MGFAQLNMIDGIYIERTRVMTDPSDPRSEKKVIESQPFRLTEAYITDGDVIAFDIPGFSDFIRENNKPLKNVTLLINNIELPEFPAFIENSESDIVRFRFATWNLRFEDRKNLYKLPGKTMKEVLIGIKIDEANVLFFNDPATLYFKEIKSWGTVGWILVIALFICFAGMVIVWDSTLKESLKGIDKNKYSAFYSFSKSQFAFWTLLILSAFIYIWAFTGDTGSINNTALILLGITSITITAGNMITKQHSDSENKLPENTNDPANDSNYRVRLLSKNRTSQFLEDILSDEDGISIHRLQAVVFNLIFGIAFIRSVIIDYSMPEFTQTQLILLGLSNGTYAFMKTKEGK
jgi:hypothetical protein